jgi:DNA-binding SARP family transcriptional activator
LPKYSHAQTIPFESIATGIDPGEYDQAAAVKFVLIDEVQGLIRPIVDELLAAYTGRFALDFAYEDWASDYRDTLHAAVLGSVEWAVNSSMDRGDHDRAIELAHEVLSLDATADSIELTLLRAYKASGRPAAAAEQYAHYSSVLRDQLGIEPPPFGDL